jgi:small ubiquitin-related modifier
VYDILAKRCRDKEEEDVLKIEYLLEFSHEQRFSTAAFPEVTLPVKAPDGATIQITVPEGALVFDAKQAAAAALGMNVYASELHLAGREVGPDSALLSACGVSDDFQLCIRAATEPAMECQLLTLYHAGLIVNEGTQWDAKLDFYLQRCWHGGATPLLRTAQLLSHFPHAQRFGAAMVPELMLKISSMDGTTVQGSVAEHALVCEAKAMAARSLGISASTFDLYKEGNETALQFDRQLATFGIAAPAATLFMLPSQSMTIRLKELAGEETYFKVNPLTAMDRVFNAFAKRKGVAVTTLRFLLDGQRVNGDQAPYDLELEDQHQLDVVLVQTGILPWEAHRGSIGIDFLRGPRSTDGAACKEGALRIVDALGRGTPLPSAFISRPGVCMLGPEARQELMRLADEQVHCRCNQSYPRHFAVAC